MKCSKILTTMVSAFILMILLTSCSKTLYKNHLLKVETPKMIKIDESLLQPTRHPVPVMLQPKNCPLVVDMYYWALEDCNAKLVNIKKAEDEVLEGK